MQVSSLVIDVLQTSGAQQAPHQASVFILTVLDRERYHTLWRALPYICAGPHKSIQQVPTLITIHSSQR